MRRGGCRWRAVCVALGVGGDDGCEHGDGGPDGRGRDAVGDVGAAYAAFQGVGSDLLGVGPQEGSMSVTRFSSGRWRAQVYDPVTGKNVSVSGVLGGPGRTRRRRRPSCDPHIRHAQEPFAARAPLTTHARDALSSLAREGTFCFVSLRGSTGPPAPAPTIGRPSEPSQTGKAASTSPPVISRAGTWSTSLKCHPRT